MTPALLLALISSPSFSYGAFVDGTETRVFAKAAPLLSDSSAGSDTLSLLPFGSELVVMSSSDGLCMVDAGGLSGFVSESDLAMASLETLDGGLFLFGISGADSTGVPLGAALIVEPDGVVLSCPFDLGRYSENGSVYYSVDAEEEDPAGLSGVDAAILLRFIYEACGYSNRDYLLVGNEEELVCGPEASSGFEAGIFSHEASMGLPSDHGEADAVVVTTRHREWIDEGEELHPHDGLRELHALLLERPLVRAGALTLTSAQQDHLRDGIRRAPLRPHEVDTRGEGGA